MNNFSNLLITGGTGTIGEAIVRSAMARGTRRICIYSRDEYKQAMLRESLKDDERLRWFIGDVRDESRLRRALQNVECVIHTAALKRVEAGEFNPGEFVKTNVLGTLNLIEACHDAGVTRVVGISTDKAVNPTNAYGASKLLAEKILLAANNARGQSGPKFSVVRFGNIACSRGSVLDIWKKKIAEGAEKLPVTDARCTRYWIDTDFAVSLVWQALENMPLIPLTPKLRAFLVTDLAMALDMPWHEIGLRDGESLHEQLTEQDSSETAPRMKVKELRKLCEDFNRQR